jgi:uncharacterized protein
MATWLETVQTIGRDAALAEDRARWGQDPNSAAKPPFAYRWEHLQYVVHVAERLARETNADMDVVLAAAWLHDTKKQAGDNHAQQAADYARQLLPTTDFPADKIEAVAEAITAHEGLWRADPAWEEPHPFVAARPMTNLEAAVLWDADKLSKIGPTGLLHALGHSMAKGESVNDFLKAIGWWREEYTRTLASFTTPPAKTQSRRLYNTTLQFLLMLEQEHPKQE